MCLVIFFLLRENIFDSMFLSGLNFFFLHFKGYLIEKTHKTYSEQRFLSMLQENGNFYLSEKFQISIKRYA